MLKNINQTQLCMIAFIAAVNSRTERCSDYVLIFYTYSQENRLDYLKLVLTSTRAMSTVPQKKTWLKQARWSWEHSEWTDTALSRVNPRVVVWTYINNNWCNNVRVMSAHIQKCMELTLNHIDMHQWKTSQNIAFKFRDMEQWEPAWLVSCMLQSTLMVKKYRASSTSPWSPGECGRAFEWSYSSPLWEQHKLSQQI